MNTYKITKEDLSAILQRLFNPREISFSDPDVEVIMETEDDISEILAYLTK